MSKHRFGNTQNFRCLLAGEPEHFLQHHRCLFLRGESARNAGEAKRDVLANFIAKFGVMHQSDYLLDSFGISYRLFFTPPTLPFAQMIETNVGCDAKDPALESRLTAIFPDIL